MLGVDNGDWTKVNGFPSITSSDNGKVLAVENGSWAAANPAYMKEVTYAELKAMRDGGTLTPGMHYRMTDYTTIITGSYDLSVIGASGYLHNARSAGHAFDLILLATGTGELSEVARAALHSGDTYFSGVDIDAWELRYCLDNNTAKFAFANSSGKGVIYWMRDEWNNQAGYDFKNVQFLRYAMSLNAANPDAVDTGLVYDASKQPNRYAGMMQIYSALMGYMESGSYVNPWGATGNYDFAVSYNILGAVQMAQPDAAYLAAFEADWYYTFDFYGDLDDVGTDAHYDASLNQHPWIPCRENYIELETDPVAALLLQEYNHVGLGGSVWETNAVFISGLDPDNKWDSINENRLGQSNFGNTFGNLCYGITAKNSCYSNTFGDSCYSNTFGNTCYRNTFGNNCYSNTFGDNCSSNTFGDNCYSNTFGDTCSSNTFGDTCYRNTFGNNCFSNTFGNNCYNNQLQGAFSHLRVDGRVMGVTVPSTMADSSHPKDMVNYDIGYGMRATWIVHTGYNTETVVSTTDGGTTWA